MASPKTDLEWIIEMDKVIKGLFPFDKKYGYIKLPDPVKCPYCDIFKIDVLDTERHKHAQRHVPDRVDLIDMFRHFNDEHYLEDLELDA